MPRRSRHPARPPAGPPPVPSFRPMGLMPWEILTIVPPAVDIVSACTRRRLTVTVPYRRVQLAVDAPVGPLVLTLRPRDREAWMAVLAQDPTRLGTLVLEQLLVTNSPRRRGRHAHRPVPGRTLRIYAAEIYLTLERWVQQDLRVLLEALQRHAKARGYAWRQMERGGRWQLSLLTAYAVEMGYPGAFDKAAPPTMDPKAFYRMYIHSRQLPAMRAMLIRTPFPRAQALLDGLIAEAPPAPRSVGADALPRP
jgi:hypothetical protein